MDLHTYLHTTFPGLTLKPSLYHQWDIRLHFEFANDIYQFKDDGTLNLDRFHLAYNQALAIFNSLFAEQDDIFLVTNIYQHKDSHTHAKPSKTYKRFLKNRQLRFTIKHMTLPFTTDHEEEYSISQFCLSCEKRDFNYPLLIKAACNEDFPLKPKLGRAKGAYYPDVFFINISKNIIFFIYDDRGCEVIANTKEALLPIYEHYNELIGEFNREETEQIFIEKR
jgi:Domain of unknown function (DUF3885)